MRAFAVSGKGGTGKTVISALMVKELIKRGVVLAIDADPDSNLPEALGVKVDRTVGDIREELLEKKHQLPPQYTKDVWLEGKTYEVLSENTGYDLLVMGRPEGPECYCMVNNLLRRIIDMLSKTYEYTVIDSEAGLEHISRRTTIGVKDMIVVVDGSQQSFDTATRIHRLTHDLGSRFDHLYIVLNKNCDAVEKAEQTPLEYLGCIPYDPEIEKASFDGVPLPDNTKAAQAVRTLLSKMKVI
ncbi:MAG: AAA family ATPase [Candidatus Methanofastidiosia archaeon]|jgi:CO dehydrogenase maturation factor